MFEDEEGDNETTPPRNDAATASSSSWWCCHCDLLSPVLWYHQLQTEASVCGRRGGRLTMGVGGWIRCAARSSTLLCLLVATYLLAVVVVLYFVMIAFGPTLLLLAIYVEPVLVTRNILRQRYNPNNNSDNDNDATTAVEVPVLRLRTFERVHPVHHTVEKYVKWLYQAPKQTATTTTATTTPKTTDRNNNPLDYDHDSDDSENNKNELPPHDCYYSDSDDDDDSNNRNNMNRAEYYEYESSYELYDEARKQKASGDADDHAVSVLVLPGAPHSGRPAVEIPKLVERSRKLAAICFLVGSIAFVSRTGGMIRSNEFECRTLEGLLDLEEQHQHLATVYQQQQQQTYDDWMAMIDHENENNNSASSSLFDANNNNTLANNNWWADYFPPRASSSNTANNDAAYAAAAKKTPLGTIPSVLSLVERVITWNIPFMEQCAFYSMVTNNHTVVLWIVLGIVEFAIALPFACAIYRYRRIFLLHASERVAMEDDENDENDDGRRRPQRSRFSVELTSIAKDGGAYRGSSDDNNNDASNRITVVRPPHPLLLADDDPFAPLEEDDDDDDDGTSGPPIRFLSKLHPKYRQHRAISNTDDDDDDC